MNKAKDLTGLRVGRLTVSERAENDASNRAQWLCVCDCGRSKVIKSAALLRADTKSCGCLGLEVRKANGDKAGQLKAHAYSRANMPAEHKTWENIKARCDNPLHVSYHAYGARGVTVCDRWMESFKNFADDMGPRPVGFTIERKNSALGYSPENCEWATRDAQANNKVTSRHITAFGRTMTVAHWSAETGLSYGYIYYRVCMKGIPAEDVLAIANPGVAAVVPIATRNHTEHVKPPPHPQARAHEVQS